MLFRFNCSCLPTIPLVYCFNIVSSYLISVKSATVNQAGGSSANCESISMTTSEAETSMVSEETGPSIVIDEPGSFFVSSETGSSMVSIEVDSFMVSS